MDYLLTCRPAAPGLPLAVIIMPSCSLKWWAVICSLLSFQPRRFHGAELAAPFLPFLAPLEKSSCCFSRGGRRLGTPSQAGWQAQETGSRLLLRG